MVKYSPTSERRRAHRDRGQIDGGVEVTLTDYDVEPFDVTQAPDADIDAADRAAQARADWGCT